MMAMRPIIYRRDKLAELELHSVTAKVMRTSRNELDENKGSVSIGIPQAKRQNAKKRENEQMLREAITACEGRQLSEPYAK
ncbi:unnamed protein product [Toxocara canis]|uniref:Transposase n=1 Tax=Toxocara canis TaxID=6265 RepID=A0A183UMN7_TOXCA|nr:unnamed protein product [Toxocara canis]